MKTIIAGGRSDHLDPLDRLLLCQLPITEVVSGGASGIDEEGERWARERSIPCTVFKADWKTFKSAAGPIRNAQMAKYADAVVLFPGGPGTQSMYREAVKAKLEIYDFRS